MHKGPAILAGSDETYRSLLPRLAGEVAGESAAAAVHHSGADHHSARSLRAQYKLLHRRTPPDDGGRVQLRFFTRFLTAGIAQHPDAAGVEERPRREPVLLEDGLRGPAIELRGLGRI